MNCAQLLGATVEGTGPRTVVFANGFATTQRAWDAIVAIVPPDWRIVRFDYVGTTPATTARWMPERYATYDGHVDDLCRLLAELEVRSAVFVGHSMSGMIGALASIRAPERFAHLVTVGASACYENHPGYEGGYSREELDELLRQADADLASWMGGFGPLSMGRDATPHMLQEYLETLQAIRPDIGRTLLRSIFDSDYRDVIRRVMARTTIVQTAHDVAVPLAAAEFLVRHTPSTGMHLLRASGHLPHITHPDLVTPVILDVLRRNSAPLHPLA